MVNTVKKSKGNPSGVRFALLLIVSTANFRIEGLVFYASFPRDKQRYVLLFSKYKNAAIKPAHNLI